MHVMTVPASFHFLRGQIRFMRDRGFDLRAIASPGDAHDWFRGEEGIETQQLAMSRSLTPVRDLVALLRLVAAFRRWRPDIVHAHTPKGGLLGMIAAFVTGVPVRIYHLRGLPLLTARGPRRAVLVIAERISCALAHRVISVSPSLRRAALDDGLCPPEKIVTLLGGSGNGVDAEVAFGPAPGDLQERESVRRRYGIPSDALVVGFVGRLVRDKGLAELSAAWATLRQRFPDAHLLLVGGAEPELALPPVVLRQLQADDRVHLTGAVAGVRALYTAMDVLTLPSYREGFPNVILEASAMALPVVTTTATGCVDAVAEGETGLTVPAGDSGALADAITRYLRDPALRATHGASGRARVQREFHRPAVWQALLEEYMTLVAERTAYRMESRLAPPPTARLLHITTIPETFGFFRGQIGFMLGAGLQVEALSSPSAELDALQRREGLPVHGVPMRRSISPLADLLSVWRIVQVLRRRRPEIVHAHTPKGGLLGMLAARMMRVPVRIYHIHGLRFMTTSGPTRLLLRWTERLASSLANEVLCVSHSVREVALRERICPPGKIRVLLGGSINGVDAIERFNPATYPTARRAVRERFGIPADAFVAGFVGRLVRDKGLSELVGAWRMLRDERPDLHLLIVGPFESEDPLTPQVENMLRTEARIHLTGPADPPSYLAAMDLLVLPTYREGFPNVPLEAAAMGLPVLATDVPGCTDAVVDGVTGRLVPARDAMALAEAMRAYLDDREMARQHGRRGRARVLRDFGQDRIWEATLARYTELLPTSVGATVLRSTTGAPDP